MKASERYLLGAFLGILLLGGAVVLWDLYRDRMALLREEYNRLELDYAEVEALLEDRDRWVRRGEWLDHTQPAFTNGEEIDNAIFEDAEAAEAAGVQTAEVQLIPRVTTPQYIQAGVTLKAEGTVESIFRWLHDLQTPETFRVVRGFKAEPHPDEDERIQCQFALLRWCANPDDHPAPAKAPAPAPPATETAAR